MRQPNLNTLRAFDAAARHLNFRLAAEEMNVTQGAVAQQVRRLEADLGLTLFRRLARGLALTETGRDYHGPVRRALALIDEATGKLRPASRQITLSLPPSMASKWLVPRLAAFAAAHPDIDLRTVASEALANFRADGVDVAIRQGRPPFGAGLCCELLAPLALVAVCSPAYRAGLDPPSDLADFAGVDLVQDSHRYWEALFTAATIPSTSRIVQFNQTALAMDAAANGQGVALAPRLLADGEIRQGRLAELWCDPQPDRAGYYIVWPADAPRNPAREEVVSWALDEVGGKRAGGA